MLLEVDGTLASQFVRERQESIEVGKGMEGIVSGTSGLGLGTRFG